MWSVAVYVREIVLVSDNINYMLYINILGLLNMTDN